MLCRDPCPNPPPPAAPGLIYDVADGLVHRLAGPFSATSGVDDTLEGFVADGARVSRCPLTHALRVHTDAISSPGSDSLSPTMKGARGSNGGGASVPVTAYEDASDDAAAATAVGGLSPRYSGTSGLRAQVNHANLVNAVIAHTTWSANGADGNHTTLATAARATASPRAHK